MNRPGAERIICCRRVDLPASWLPESGTIRMTWDVLLGVLAHVEPLLRDRSSAETDRAYKQLIPYVLMRNELGAMAQYERAGSEERLHGKLSLGVGGHVGEMDMPAGGAFSWATAILRCVDREIMEELAVRPPAEGLSFLGLINEEVSLVGRVHLGVVWLFSPASDLVLRPGEELREFEWRCVRKLEPARLELWSKLALNLLQMAGCGESANKRLGERARLKDADD